MSDHEFEKLDDDELRERVLDAVETIEQVWSSGPGGVATKGSPPSGSAGEAVDDLKELFGADEADLGTADEDAKGWM